MFCNNLLFVIVNAELLDVLPSKRKHEDDSDDSDESSGDDQDELDV
jgi:origin recognition complex subunit 6